MRCPSCQAYMRVILYEGIEIETCDKCKGEWLDADELLKITVLREQQFDAEMCRVILDSPTYTGVLGKLLTDRKLVCPKCEGNTIPINYGGGTGIIIERCTGCGGVWLDDQELEKIQIMVEGWEDGLSADLQKYSGVLSDIAVATEVLDETDEQKPSRIPVIGSFINACVNGIIKITT